MTSWRQEAPKRLSLLHTAGPRKRATSDIDVTRLGSAQTKLSRHTTWVTLEPNTCDLAIGDLAIGCLGVRATESLDVRVATNFVKMMRKESCEK